MGRTVIVVTNLFARQVPDLWYWPNWR